MRRQAYRKKTTITLQMKGKSIYGAEDRYSSEPQKVHLTGEFVIEAKFGQIINFSQKTYGSHKRQCLQTCSPAYNDKHIQLQIQKPPKQDHTTTHDKSKNKYKTQHKAYKDINSS